MGLVKLLLFDIDGTLVWTKGAGRAALIDALATLFAHQPPLAERLRDRVAAHVFGGKTDWYTLVELLADEGYAAEQIAALIREFDPVMGASMARVIHDYAVQPCTGGVETITALKVRADVRLGLVTGNVRSSAPIKLKAAGYQPEDFPIGAFGDEALERDDLPRLAFERAQTHYQCAFDPQDVIVIGDTLADIACARASGFAVAAVCTGFAKRDELAAASPDWLLDDLRSFAEHVLA